MQVGCQTVIFRVHKWALTRESLSSAFVNNKDTDQPAHPCRLIRALVIRCLESIISKLATSEISIFLLVRVPEETGLSIALSETLKTGFVATRSK